MNLREKIQLKSLCHITIWRFRYNHTRKYMLKNPCMFLDWPPCPCQVLPLAQGFSELQRQGSGLCTLVPCWNENSAHQWAGCICVHDSAVHLWDKWTNSLLKKRCFNKVEKNTVNIWISPILAGPNFVRIVFHLPEQVSKRVTYLWGILEEKIIQKSKKTWADLLWSISAQT